MAFLKRLPRTFGLRTLLLSALVCAVGLGVYCNRQWPYEARQVKPGMTEAEVLATFGRPIVRQGSRRLSIFQYKYDWGGLSIRLEQGRCAGAAFIVADEWPDTYLVTPDGTICRSPLLTSLVGGSPRPSR